MRWGGVVAALLAALTPAAGPAAAQVPDSLPPPPDTLVILLDTLPVLDSAVVVDTLPSPDTVALPDTSVLLVVPDTALVRGEPLDSVAADTVFHQVPELRAGAPPGFASATWILGREDILGSRALTLAELVATIPGVIPLRGGDFGTPRIASAFGLAGGGVRVFWDGFELLPLDGGVTDLARVGLGGVERVRVERHPTELRIEITSLRNHGARPYTLIQAGTGDLSTNFFRGTFVHPRVAYGSIGLSLDRLDTRGTQGAEMGTQQGLWLRYTWHGGDRWGVTGELRRMKAESEVQRYPLTSTRTDWLVRARGRLLPHLVAEAFTGRSDLESDFLAGDLRAPDAGAVVIPGEPTAVRRERTQHGLRAAWTPGPVWASAALRLLGGHDVPSTSVELAGGGELAGLGGASASLSRETWGADAATLARLQAWTAPVLGVSAFGSWTSGRRGVRVDTLLGPRPTPPERFEPYAPSHRITDRSALRAGLRWRWRGAEVAAAALKLTTDSLALLGTPLDRNGRVLPGVERTGWEAAARLPLPFAPDGFALTGSLQWWNKGARYLPQRQYQAALDFHDLFLESGNLEVWGALGVQGRDPMVVPLAAAVEAGEEPGGDPDGEPLPLPFVPATVPFYQSWYAYLQVRVVTVRIFIRWENFTLRQRNQDFPGRLLPFTRALYGVRWTLWN